MKTIRDWLNEYVDAMVQEFESHNNHSEYDNDFDINGLYENLKNTDVQTLRYEKHAHYAKWMYNGVHKKTHPETDTLINDSNVNFLLWVRLQIESRKFKGE